MKRSLNGNTLIVTSPCTVELQEGSESRDSMVPFFTYVAYIYIYIYVCISVYIKEMLIKV